jgi:hypothetical protein
MGWFAKTIHMSILHNHFNCMDNFKDKSEVVCKNNSSLFYTIISVVWLSMDNSKDNFDQNQVI